VIDVTRFNDTQFVLNAELIQTIEETPDTVITLTTGTKYVVKETCEEIKKKVLNYKRSIFAPFSEIK
jgi:flagellar protein FlbD